MCVCVYVCMCVCDIASPDGPDLATKIRVPLVSGDIVILASDGIYDNVYESQVVGKTLSGKGLGFRV